MISYPTCTVGTGYISWCGTVRFPYSAFTSRHHNAVIGDSFILVWAYFFCPEMHATPRWLKENKTNFNNLMLDASCLMLL
jgi:hypothetical protein